MKQVLHFLHKKCLFSAYDSRSRVWLSFCAGCLCGLFAQFLLRVLHVRMFAYSAQCTRFVLSALMVACFLQRVPILHILHFL